MSIRESVNSLRDSVGLKAVQGGDDHFVEPLQKKLLIFETDETISPSTLENVRSAIRPTAEKFGFEFMVLHSGVKLKTIL